MKKFFAILLTSATAFTAVFATPGDSISIETQNLYQNLKIVNICDLTDSELDEIMVGNQPETAIQFSEQTTIPLNIFLKGDLINLIDDEKFGTLVIKQTFYMRCINEDLFFSLDLNDWKSLSKFTTGDASFGLTVENGQPTITFDSEINHRP